MNKLKMKLGILRADSGENSIMQTITIAVSAILIAAGLTTAPGLINNARDNNAREDAKNLAYAQGVYESEYASYTPNIETLRNQSGKVKITKSEGTDGILLVAGTCAPIGTPVDSRPACVNTSPITNITNVVADAGANKLESHQFNGLTGSILPNATNGHNAIRGTKNAAGTAATAIYYNRLDRFVIPADSVGVTYSAVASLRSSKDASFRFRMVCNASTGTNYLGLTNVDLVANAWTTVRVSGAVTAGCNTLSLDMVGNAASSLVVGDTYDMAEPMIVRGNYTGPFVYAGTPGWTIDASGVSTGPVPTSDYISPEANPSSYGGSDCFAVFAASKSGNTFYTYSGKSGVFKMAEVWPTSAPSGYPVNCAWPASRANVVATNVLAISTASGDADVSAYPVDATSSNLVVSKESAAGLSRAGESVKMVITAPTSSALGAGPRTVTGTISGGMTYRIEMWVKTNDASLNLSMNVKWKGENSATISDTLTPVVLKSTDGWKKISVEAVAPANASYIHMPLVVQGIGVSTPATVYMDDWSIIRTNQ